MDGYSVEQAAEVLGIPQGRVWELIARGVLAGASEGGATMRVYLKPAIPPAAPPTEPAGRGNGEHGRTNGDSHGELSPFRELLTEFRNLTERYGQALLALGEARGEVAALRGRVDLLEARMETRLPMRPASTVAWEMPGYPPSPAERPHTTPDEAPADATSQAPPAAAEPEAAEPEAPGPEAAEPEAPGPEAAEPEAVQAEPPGRSTVHEVANEAPAEPTEGAAASDADSPTQHVDGGKRRVTGSRAAVAGLAEALARAEDPALLDLPGAREAAEAYAALRRQADEAARAEDSGEQLAEPAEPAEPAEELSTDAAEAIAPYAEDLAAYAPTIELADEAEAAGAPEPIADELPPAPAEAVSHDEAQGDVSVAASDSPYTTEVVEPDWFADGDFAWLDDSRPEPTPETQPVADAVDASWEPAPEVAAPQDQTVESGPDSSADAGQAEAEQEHPADESIQDAFDEPEPREATAVPSESGFEAPIEPGPAELEHAEAEHLESGHERPAAAAIQDAFDETQPADETESSWPDTDVPGPAASSEPTAGFGLFRGQPERVEPIPPRVETPRSTRDEEALMWLGDEFEAASLEVAAPGWHSDETTSEPVTPVLQLSDAEIEQLAATEGWDRAEINAIRDLIGRPVDELPLPEESPEDASPPAGETPDAQPGPPSETSGSAPRKPSPAERIPWVTPASGPEGAADPEWLQGRRGPAADAYRRLKRLFQN